MKRSPPVLVVAGLLILLCVALAAVVGTALWWVGQLAREPVGTVFTYQVDPSSAGPVDMDEVVAVLQRRMDRDDGPLAEVRAVDDRTIEIGVHGRDPRRVREVEQLVPVAGTLEFRILANDRDHGELIERAEASESRELRDGKGKLLAWWIPVTEASRADFAPKPGQTEEDFCQYAGGIAMRRSDKGEVQVLVVKDIFDIDGRYLDDVHSGLDDRDKPYINFAFTANGAELFGGFTGSNLPDPSTRFARRLGIILNGRLHSAPNIQSTIFDRGQITGNFTREEVERLVSVLDAGTLPVRLEKIGERDQ